MHKINILIEITIEKHCGLATRLNVLLSYCQTINHEQHTVRDESISIYSSYYKPTKGETIYFLLNILQYAH